MMALDRRQRAMLREMGIRIWQPLPEAALPVTPAQSASAPSQLKKPEVAADSVAIDSGAPGARIHLAIASFNTQKQPLQTVPAAAPADTVSTAAAWRVGALQTLYADTAVAQASRWLVLLEAPASALEDNFNPLDGDAGRLLDNMLRAAKLHLAGSVVLAPLVRSGIGGGLPAALTNLLASAQADVVLVMGRLAAQALLQSTEPLARLRGQIHAVVGQHIVITLDPSYLLRNPLEKAKAWDDLCLALSIVSAAGPVSAP